MHIHILGICGTFMGGIAVLAKQAGHKVTGCDADVYPPMSTQLEAQGIALIEGFDPAQIKLEPDMFVIGNVVSRGNPLMEEILNRGLPYISGPQWLAEHVLRDKWVLAVAGTHGKTTTTSMLAWILEYAGLNPGFLIGGVPQNFGMSARLTDSPFFVDRGGRIRHRLFRQALQVRPLPPAHRGAQQPGIRPRRHLSRPGRDRDPVSSSGAHRARQRPDRRQRARGKPGARACSAAAGRRWNVSASAQGWTDRRGRIRWPSRKQFQGTLHWELLGEHNRMNALAAIAAARHAGVPAELGIEALANSRTSSGAWKCAAW